MTNIETLVGGQLMVSLDDAAIRFSSASKLDFDFDLAEDPPEPQPEIRAGHLRQLLRRQPGALQLIKES